jgi:hypothetical protein
MTKSPGSSYGPPALSWDPYPFIPGTREPCWDPRSPLGIVFLLLSRVVPQPPHFKRSRHLNLGGTGSGTAMSVWRAVGLPLPMYRLGFQLTSVGQSKVFDPYHYFGFPSRLEGGRIYFIFYCHTVRYLNLQLNIPYTPYIRIAIYQWALITDCNNV